MVVEIQVIDQTFLEVAHTTTPGPLLPGPASVPPVRFVSLPPHSHGHRVLPGVAALRLLQDELRHAEQSLAFSASGCPFAGASTHLYPKGSIGRMKYKRGHDDRNGPACATCWQNLGTVASGARLQLVVVINGHDVIVDAPAGTMVLFQGWLPHLTRADPEGPPSARSDWRLHHTAYARFGTEWFGWVARAHRLAGCGLRTRKL